MNNAQQEYPGITSMREWMLAVSDGKKYTLNYHPSCLAEVLQMADNSLKIPKFLGSKGIKCSGHWVGDISKSGFTVKANGCEFKCHPLSSYKKGVAETSREAYRSINLDTLQREVVRAALEVGETYDRDLAERIGKGPNDVSARRNELELADFEYNGKMYRIEYHAQKPSKHTNRRVQWWRVVEAVNGQTSLF